MMGTGTQERFGVTALIISVFDRNLKRRGYRLRTSFDSNQTLDHLYLCGTKEFAHLEMIATMVYKLTKDATPEQLKEAGLGDHYANHDKALFYQNASGVPWVAAYIQAKGDPIADLYEDIAAEEKARATYQWLIDMTDDVDLQDSLKFLREREVVHSQRFREAVEILKAEQNAKKFF